MRRKSSTLVELLLVFILACLVLVIPCTAEVIVCFPMDSDPDWTTEGQWEFGVPQGGGGPQSYDPTSGYTGANVYGYNLAGNYENDMAEYRLTTSAINCKLAENVKLSFWRWLGVESSLYDHAKIQVSNDGTNWTDVWVNGEGNLADSSWVYCEYNISAVADRQATVFVRWCMGPTDFSMAYAGWNIDDLCLDGDLLDALFISPNDIFFSLGLEGGPFEPPCKTYTLTNNGTSTVSWTAAGTQSWLDVTPGSGVLTPGAFVAVEICINSTANTLDEGEYTDTVSFTDTNSGFSYSIDVMLYVGATICVPLQFPTIQSAINASSNGDTIVVLDGTYTGDGNRDIDFNGRAITLKSLNGPESCIIDCEEDEWHHHRGFYFHRGENSQSIIDGFTITGGFVCSHGAGIYCENSSPTISNCIISGNVAKCYPEVTYGGGIYCDNSSPTISDCIISGNRAGVRGGGIYCCNNSCPVITNCTLLSNSSFTQSGAMGQFFSGVGGGMDNDHSNPVLINCTFESNYAISAGGMYNSYSNPVLTNCTLRSNRADDRGGMDNYYSNPTLTNCVFTNNRAHYRMNEVGIYYSGVCGGMYNDHSDPTLTNCIFEENRARGMEDAGGLGGGMYNTTSDPILTNCTFAGNEADGGYGLAGGMYNSTGKPRLTNCIFWGNSDDGGVDESAQIYTEGVGGPFINYSCIQGWTGGLGGSGNIGADPCFADVVANDFHLKSVAGRWDANRESWVQDDVNSLCIDAGDPNSDWTAELWPHGKRINMGAYGGTPEASMSALDIGNVADLNNDDFVGYRDMMLFTGKWLYEAVLLAEDLNRDGIVNFTDFAIFADNWEPPPLPGQASNPNPADGATDVSLTAELSWTAGAHATSHDVYFGMSSPPPFIRNQTAATFDPCTMAPSTTHYWRIDELNPWGTTTGTVWSFTTIALEATNPNPANGATQVDINADLSWTASYGATSHDVYFGTSNPPPFIRNQTATTFDPCTMAYNTTYYWRIDELNPWGTITGTVWSFTTIALEATNPNPADGATEVNTTADLSWTAGADATSHDVYFGTSSTPPFIHNQSGTTFEPGTMITGTMYYWRIDEVGAHGTITGTVWRFTTFGPPR